MRTFFVRVVFMLFVLHRIEVNLYREMFSICEVSFFKRICMCVRVVNLT